MRTTIKPGLVTWLLLWSFLWFPAFVQGSEQAEVFLQLGHASYATSIAFSPDGRWVLSGSEDKTLKLWEVATGREFRSFTGHTDRINAVACSPDGRWVLSGSEDKTLKLWEVATGREVRTFAGHTSAVRSVAFSPDGRWVLSGGLEETMKLWEVATGREMRSFSGHAYGVYSAAFSPNGRWALSGSGDKLKLWEVGTGREVRSFSGHADGVDSAAFSPDGRWVLSGSEDKTLKLWEVATGREVRTFAGHTSAVRSVAFSPDGRWALSGSEDKTLKLWEVATGREMRSFSGHAYGVYSAAFSPDGRWALSGSEDKTLKLWEVATGREVRTFSGYADPVYSVAFSPDGRWALSGSKDKTLKLWEIATGREVGTWIGHTNSAVSVAFSPDGRWALSGSIDKTLKLWEVATGREVRTFAGHTDSVWSAAFSPDGKWGLSGSGDMTLKLWEVATGREVRSFTGHTDRINAVAFSPDGRWALSGSADNTIKRWEVETGREVGTWIGHTNWVMSVAFSPDGKWGLSGSGDMTLKLWEVATGREVRTFGHESWVLSVAFSPDGRWVLGGGGGSEMLKLWEVATGRKVRNFSGHAYGVNSLAFSPDGRWALAGEHDGQSRLWNVSNGQEFLRLIGFPEGESLAMTPEGYYTSSAGGDKYLNVRIGSRVTGIDQYRTTFYKPQVVEAALRLGDSRQALAEVLGTGGVRPTTATIQDIEPPFLVIKAPEDGATLSSQDMTLSLHVEDRRHPLKGGKIQVNGAVVSRSDSRDLQVTAKTGGASLGTNGLVIPEGQKVLDLKVPLRLERGENLIEVAMTNGFSEGRAAVRVTTGSSLTQASGESLLPNLWILAIGVNAYQDRQIQGLTYAAADAEGIVTAFQGQQGKLFRTVNSLVISDHAAVKPTFDNIVDNLTYLSNAGQQDVVVLFLAGHGINDERGEFYFLPNDAVVGSDGAVKRSRAISWRDLKAVVDLPAKKLVFVDTCHSEGLSGKKTRAVDNDRLVKELQEFNPVLFTSSRGRELSQEDPKWGHGAFTYALIEGLKGKADLVKDGKVSMKELDAYVSETVPQLTNGAQHPITNTPDGYLNFPVAMVP